LTHELGAAEIWIKRDDCTGLGMGGNKVRKLEFLAAEARGQDADTLVTIGAAQSNHIRLTAAAARAAGFESVSIIFGGEKLENEGNLFLDRLLASQIVTLPFGLGEATPEKVDRAVAETLDRLKSAGRTPYFIPAGGAVPVGCLGYLRAAEEMAHQVKRKGVPIDTVVVAVGTGGTLAGLVLGADALRLKWDILGHSVMKAGAAQSAGIAPVEDLVRQAGALIGYEARPERVRWSVSYDYVGEDYGVLSDGAVEAIRLLARSDGILLDPVYTGKAMAGLIDLVRTGRLGAERKVLFLHTGGAPALFAHPEVLPDDTPVPPVRPS
jgi:D-cysteine desulfhydrase family pyridoxal phosphate-dependent enzyme